MRTMWMLVLSLFTLGGCSSGGTAEVLSCPLEGTMENSFARFYEPVEWSFSPDMMEMGLPVDPSKVINIREALFYNGLSELPEPLSRNGFVVLPAGRPTDNPVTAFQRLEDTGLPVYVSSGIPLHLLHVFFDQILQQVETDHLYGDLVIVCTALYESSLARDDLTGAAFFAVPLAWLDGGFSPDQRISENVEAEVALMEAHQGFAESPVFGYEEDYSQYVPRGHYTASEELENYFMAMMYLGRLTFPLKGGSPWGPQEEFLVSAEDAERLTTTALLMVSDLNTLTDEEGDPLIGKWRRIYEITAFFAGFADDLSVMEYQRAAAETAGESFDSSLLSTDGFRGSFLAYIVENFRGPSIYSGTGASAVMPDQAGDFDPEDFAGLLGKTTGFRFLGQRYTPDSHMLGNMVFPSVGRNDRGEERFMPSGLDVAAAFRCQAALEIIQENGTTTHLHYPDTLVSMQAMIDGYSMDDWHATLYMCWLHSLRLLAAPRGAGYPDFMQTDGWNRCTLSTFLASWAMLRHDTILYAKQSYTALAGCAPPMEEEPVPSAGFVEPVPEVYAELRATLGMARNGLEHYDLLEGDIARRFESAESLLERLQDIAERELEGGLLTEDDADFLKGFASYLESAISWGGDTTEGLETSLIADVHTDQNTGSVLEVASGNLDNCVVIYRRADGVVEAAVGPVLSYYEFTWPMGDRLTDEAWRELLEDDPERLEWTGDYLVLPSAP
ncbi:MAG TPA: DUF3160 domain-containing protein [Candidatus Sabulitectum sp.]|nr:DUF3160 domain-containing protein [Candidatus Sabulitectum sp.]